MCCIRFHDLRCSDFSTTVNIYAHPDHRAELFAADAVLDQLGFDQSVK